MKIDSYRQLPQFIDHLHSMGRYWFSSSEVETAMSLSKKAAIKALWRMSRKHMVCRIRNDFYVVVPPEYRAARCLPAEWFIDALMASIGHDYYVSLLTAATLQGATHQQVMIFQVITDIRLRPLSVGNQQIIFHFKKQLPNKIYLQQIRSPASYFYISSPELTILDLVSYMDVSGQLNVVATVLYELVDQVDFREILKIVEAGETKIFIAQRLGYILEIIKPSVNLDNLRELIMAKKPKYLKLLPGGQEILRKDNNWRILVNEEIEMDDL
jgi:predicted transcriptional regulator of viral defense system